ncbi:unnamed protein product [Oikopleura dioica]|uniref:Uncharacterized protein n=1 Tax=Oikopleura dioica TaxID=34765 RepID=E4XM39_OIKDI|nr:unnamed protein product [Oikopleura dioica]
MQLKKRFQAHLILEIFSKHKKALQVSRTNNLTDEAERIRTTDDIAESREIFGRNEIIVKVPSIIEIFYKEVFNFFYVFQLFSVILWSIDEYVAYAMSILILTIISVVILIYNIEKNHLIPGEKISLKNGDVIPADLVLLRGEVVVDEAMLTGESVPVVKLPLPSTQTYFTPDSFKNSMISSGTTVLQTRGVPEAVVFRTGFSTTRGNLVRSILYPKPVKVKFESDAFWFVIGMFIVALFGFAYTVVTHYYGCIPGGEIVVKGLDLITISVPPALPLAMAIGSIHAQRRLTKSKIFTLAPNRINLGGGINICLFDKTGTLTQDGLSYAGVVPKASKNGEILTIYAVLKTLLGLCHTLTVIKDKLTGDPLEVALFEATGWTLPTDSSSQNLVVKDSKSGEEWIHIKTFPFTSETARQTVLAKNQRSLFATKQACLKISMKFLKTLTSQGLRIIAYAQKDGTEEDAEKNRFVVEDKIKFEGFAILRNDLKEETPGVLKNLQKAGIRTLMVTGDNLNTAVAVAKKCNLFESRLEVIKPSFDKSDFPHLVESIFSKTSIFARVSPNQKADIVARYEDMDQIASFCGDGANDVAALKRASVGISLSELEASVAAPFTSQVADIRCVEELIKEGRCSLVTTVGMFKWIALYSFIQMITILISYWNLSNLSDWSYLYIDLFMLEPLALTFGLTAAYHKISKRIPDSRLLTARTMTSTAMHILLVAIAQMVVYLFTVEQEWYCSISSDQPECFIRDNDAKLLKKLKDFSLLILRVLTLSWTYQMVFSALFYMTCFQYLFFIMIFSRGAPFRKPVFTNWILMLTSAGLLASTLCLLFIDSDGIYDTFKFDFTADDVDEGFLSENATGPVYYPPIPPAGDDNYGSFRGILVAIAAVQIVISLAFEELVISREWLWNFVKRCQRKRHKGKRFRQIDEDVNAATNWPYLKEKNESKI